MLVDHQIRKLCTAKRPLVSPYSPEMVGPHSLTLSVGHILLFTAPHTEMDFPNIQRFPLPGSPIPRSWAALNLSKYSEEHPWSIPAKAIVLVKTMETLELPSTVVAQIGIVPRNLLHGYGLLSPLVIDSASDGQLTLAVLNHNPYNTLPIFPGLELAQLTFTRTRYKPVGEEPRLLKEGQLLLTEGTA